MQGRRGSLLAPQSGVPQRIFHTSTCASRTGHLRITPGARLDHSEGAAPMSSGRAGSGPPWSPSSSQGRLWPCFGITKELTKKFPGSSNAAPSRTDSTYGHAQNAEQPCVSVVVICIIVWDLPHVEGEQTLQGPAAQVAGVTHQHCRAPAAASARCHPPRPQRLSSFARPSWAANRHLNRPQVFKDTTKHRCFQ